MISDSGWPRAAAFSTARLILEPLRVDHAAELAPALDDEALHRYIGGQPATAEELRSRFAAQIVGHSPEVARAGSTGWSVPETQEPPSARSRPACTERPV